MPKTRRKSAAANAAQEDSHDVDVGNNNGDHDDQDDDDQVSVVSSVGSRSSARLQNKRKRNKAATASVVSAVAMNAVEFGGQPPLQQLFEEEERDEDFLQQGFSPPEPPLRKPNKRRKTAAATPAKKESAAAAATAAANERMKEEEEDKEESESDVVVADVQIDDDDDDDVKMPASIVVAVLPTNGQHNAAAAAESSTTTATAVAVASTVVATAAAAAAVNTIVAVHQQDLLLHMPSSNHHDRSTAINAAAAGSTTATPTNKNINNDNNNNNSAADTLPPAAFAAAADARQPQQQQQLLHHHQRARFVSGRLVLEPQPTPFKQRQQQQQQQQQVYDYPHFLAPERQQQQQQRPEGEHAAAAAAGGDEHDHDEQAAVAPVFLDRVRDLLVVARDRTMAIVVEVANVVTEQATTRFWQQQQRRDDDDEQGGDRNNMNGNDDDNGDDTTGKSSSLDRTFVWFILFLVLQLVLFPLWLNPILSSTVAFSKVCLGVYQGLLVGVVTAAAPPKAAVDDIVDVVAQEINTNNTYDQRMRDTVATLQALHAELQAETKQQQEAIRRLDAESVKLQNTVEQEETEIQQRARKLAAVVDQLELLVLLDESLIHNPFVTMVAGLLTKDGSSNSGSNGTLLDVSKLELWPIPIAESHNNVASCADDETEGDDGGMAVQLLLSNLEAALEQLQKEANDAAIAIQQDSNSVSAVQAWIRDAMEQEIGRVMALSAEDADTATTTTTTGTAKLDAAEDDRMLERVRKIISSRLAVDLADQTGQIDYASIHNGATVVSSSPSLVDNMPVLNRLGAVMGLRFYGYGPKAALTPTHPPNALGQCWAFEKQGDRDKPFGMLMVLLAKPIFVESVMVEHPPKELSDRVTTAVRGFSVIGFEYDGSGKAWHLGSFEYDLTDTSTRQEFSVADMVDEEEVPALRVIRLEIDSNWGAEYTCLYRFRVHGEEEKTE